MKKIRTNKISVVFDFEKIKRDFEIYKITTTEKYIYGGATLLDTPFIKSKARSLVFEYGNSFYVLYMKNAAFMNDIRRNLLNEEKGETLKVEIVHADKISEHLLVQLFLNGINNPSNELLSFNNLTGKLVCYRNDWLSKDKEGFIWGLDCLQLKIESDMCLNIRAHRLSALALKKKMKFEKRKFSDYPQYLFTDHYQTLKRADSGEVNQKENFIMKPIEGERASITYLNFENKEKFECTKIGVLYKVLSLLEKEYADYFKLDLVQYKTSQCLEYKNSELIKFKAIINELVASNGIVLIDRIEDETSKMYLEKLKVLLKIKLTGLEVSFGKRVSKNKMNIKLIHNKAYYSEKSYDPHNDIHDGAAVQHITLEDFRLDADAAISNVLKETVIKKDLVKQEISLVNWQEYAYQNDWIFAIKEGGQYYFMTVHPDGKFNIECMVRDIFNMTKFDKYMDYFGDIEVTKYDYQGVIGITQNMLGEINLIRDTNQFTMPEVNLIGDIIELASKDLKIPGSYIRDSLKRIIPSNIDSDKRITALKEAIEQFDILMLYDKAEVLSKISNQTVRKMLVKFILDDIGELLYLYLRGKENRNEFLPGMIDINYIELDTNEALYSVGTVGAGMRAVIERANVVRKVEAVEGSKLFFKELLPLMGVEFVRYGMLTVMPFPFKYLREYASLQTIKSKG